MLKYRIYTPELLLLFQDPKTNIGETTVTVEGEPAVDLESEPALDTAEPDPAEPEPTVIAESQVEILLFLALIWHPNRNGMFFLTSSTKKRLH